MCLVPVNPEEKIARYIFDNNKIKRSILKVRHTAFMPTAGCLSVFRIYDLSEDYIWEKGEELGASRGRPVLAHADVKAQIILDNKLIIDPDNDPPRHANIVGWPIDDSAAKLKALELADKATLSLKSE